MVAYEELTMFHQVFVDFIDKIHAIVFSRLFHLQLLA